MVGEGLHLLFDVEVERCQPRGEADGPQPFQHLCRAKVIAAKASGEVDFKVFQEQAVLHERNEMQWVTLHELAPEISRACSK